MKTIFVTFEFEGEHSYPDAPDQVKYLRSTHRHLFHVRAEVEVFHNDRELEFHMFKRELKQLYTEYERCNHKSCEMMCDDLGDYIMKHYPDRAYNITVSEDGENGSVLYSV